MDKHGRSPSSIRPTGSARVDARRPARCDHAIRSSRGCLFLFGSCAVAFAAPARADTGHIGWDIAAEAGLTKRFTTAAAPAAPEPGLGAAFELQGHVALLPMVRLGAYVVQDISPASGTAAREQWAGGLHLKLIPPLLPAPWRVWLFAGFGYAWAYAPSYTARDASTPAGGSRDVRVDGVAGSLLEVPLGVGVGYRVRRPWELFAELGARFGIAFWGAMYAAGATGVGDGSPAAAQPFIGKDSFALSLSLGLSLAE